jgi:uncharacterized protein (DUF1015 family)
MPPVFDHAGPAGVGIAPFRGWRIAPHRIQDLATRYSTPWDQQGNTDAAAETVSVLRAWKRSGTIVRDSRPLFYAYRQTGPRGTQVGLLAAVHLDSKLLPHEDVNASYADGIAELLHNGQANLGPILLGYSGTGRTTEYLTDATRQGPLTEVLADDGQLHRIWPVTHPGAHPDIVDELATRSAFIADGHHRHVAARQLRRDYHAAGDTSGPWDYIYGLLVDVKASPLRLAPVHRVLPHLDPDQALRAAATRFRVVPLRGELRDWLRTLKEHARSGPTFVIVAPHGAFLLTQPDRAFLAGVLQWQPAPLHRLHLSVLHAALIDNLWNTPDLPEWIGYEASATTAVRQVQRHGGLAVLLTPPSRTDIEAAAAAGLRLPTKATSFGPKPHPSLVLRTLDEP